MAPRKIIRREVKDKMVFFAKRKLKLDKDEIKEGFKELSVDEVEEAKRKLKKIG